MPCTATGRDPILNRLVESTLGDPEPAWFWPAASFGTTAEIDLRPGGRYRIEATRAGMAVSGEYLKVEAPVLLAFTWQWDGEDETTEVTIRLTATADGCLLDLIHDRFGAETARDDNARGWSDCLDRLPGFLAGTAPHDR